MQPMIITSKITMDFQRPGKPPVINAVQNDRYSRNLEITLFDDGVPWQIPEDADVLIRYCKPDATGGEYDLLPDGTGAWAAEGNALTVALAPQVLTVAGSVMLSVVLLSSERQISTFGIVIQVTAAVETGCAFHMDGFFKAFVVGIGRILGDGQQVGMVIAVDLAMLTHDADGAVHLVGQTAQVESGSDAVPELDDCDLMVAHIVVAMEYAAAVGAGLHGFHQTLFGLILGNHGSGPLTQLAQVSLPDIEAAGICHRAFQTALAAAGRGILFPEEGSAAEGRNGLCLTVCKPDQNIHIVAGLLHNDGAGLRRLPPVAADEGMCHVEVAHIFRVLNGDSLTQSAGVQDLLDGGEEIGVAQNMAHHDLSAVFMCRLLDLQTLHGVRRDGFFQKDVVTHFQRPESLYVMIPVHSRKDHSVRDLTGGKEGFRI